MRCVRSSAPLHPRKVFPHRASAETRRIARSSGAAVAWGAWTPPGSRSRARRAWPLEGARSIGPLLDPAEVARSLGRVAQATAAPLLPRRSLESAVVRQGRRDDGRLVRDRPRGGAAGRRGRRHDGRRRARRGQARASSRARSRDAGGDARAYVTDLSDMEAIDALAAQLAADGLDVDVLVNNAARSIRRSIAESYDRFHDYERTMRLNYFGAVRLTLALLPGHARAAAGSRRQREHARGADDHAALLRLPRVEGRARGVHARRRRRVPGRRRALHDRPHAARAHADEPGDEALRRDARAVPGGGRRADLRRAAQPRRAGRPARRRARRGRPRDLARVGQRGAPRALPRGARKPTP